jgi:hypothetical protein
MRWRVLIVRMDLLLREFGISLVQTLLPNIYCIQYTVPYVERSENVTLLHAAFVFGRKRYSSLLVNSLLIG